MSLNFLVWGQVNSDTLIATTLDSVVISASRYSLPLNEIPYSIKSIEQISSKHVGSLKEILQTTPGIIINNRYNFSQGDKIILRGIGIRSAFGVRGIKIFLDGIPLTFTDGQSQLNNLDMQNIDKIEIVKVSSSTLYGNSLGGAILFESVLTKQEFYIQPEISLGSFGFRNYNVSSGGNILNGNYSINAYSTEAEGFRKHSDAKFYGVNFLAKFNIHKNILLSIISNYYDAPYLLNPSSLNKSDAENNPTSVRNSVLSFVTGKQIKQFQNGISLQFNLNSNSKIKSTFYTASRSLNNSIPGRIIELDRFFAGARVEFDNKLNLFGKEITSLVGVDYETQLDKRKEFGNGGIDNYSELNPNKLFGDIIYEDKLIEQDESVTSLGLFSHFSFRLSNLITLFAGIRYDDYSFEVEETLLNNNISNVSLDNFSEMFGMSYKLKNNLTLYCNYSNGFQTPTTNEFSNNPLREGGFNNSLKPEQIDNYEVGLRGWWLNPNLFANISLYNLNITDMLISYQNEDELSYYRNAGSANNIGFEIDFEIQLIRDLRFQSSYTFMNFKFTDYRVIEKVNDIGQEFQLSDNYLPGIPKHNIVLSASYNFFNDLTSTFVFNWTDKYFTNDFNGPIDASDNNLNDYVNNAYLVCNFNLLYSHQFNFAKVNIKVNVENLFNVRYNDSIIPNAFGNNYFEPASGRSYYLTTSISI